MRAPALVVDGVRLAAARLPRSTCGIPVECRAMRRLAWLVAALATVLLPPATHAARLPFRTYQTGDGLPQSQVLAVYQDRRSELWIGTWCGAARFDGAQFRYLTQRSGLPSNYVRRIVEDRAGDLWMAVGTGLARVAADAPDRVAEVVEPLVPSARPSAVRDLRIDGGGVLWALTAEDGVARRQGGRFTTIPTGAVDDDGLQLLAEAPDGTPLVGTLGGVVAIEDGAARPWRPGPWHGGVRVLATTAAREVVVGTTDGVWLVRGDAAPVELKANGHAITLSRAALRDRRGRLWIGSEDGAFVEDDSAGFTRIGVDEGLGSANVLSLHEDREGNIWFGTDSGLSRLSGESFRAYGALDGVEAGPWSLAVDDAGAVVIGTADGVQRFDGRRFVRVPGLRGQTVRALVTDSAGRLWAGTRDDGLFRQDGATWTQWKPPAIPERRVFAAGRTRDGSLWFGLRRGLVRWREKDGITVWRKQDGLPDDTVWSIAEEASGRLVLGTDSGLVTFDGTSFSVPPAFARFQGVAVRAVLARRDGTVWVGTNGRGLSRWDGRLWQDLFAGDGPSDDFVWGLREDAESRLWVATNHGFDLFDGKRWSNFSMRDGLPGEEIAVNATLLAPDGGVWFALPTPPSLIRFAPDPLGTERQPPVVRLTGVATAARTLRPDEHLQLGWDERDVTFSYIGISFRDERRVVYRTMLEGYDPDYGPETAVRSVRYTNLAPGRYRFRVRAAGPGGVWTPQPASVDLEIVAPFWMEAPFRAAAGLALVLALLLGLRWRTRALRHERDRLEALVGERTRSLQEQVAETERLKEVYQRLSLTDALTGLYNRRSFLEHLERELARARRHGEPVALLVVDVDHFKAVNDGWGHLAGDGVLVEISQRLRDAVRSSDLIARYGGEEFVIALFNADRAGALERGEALRAAVARAPVRHVEGVVDVTVSVGLAWHDYAGDGGPDVDTLVRAADAALYRAKRAGRNRVEAAA